MGINLNKLDFFLISNTFTRMSPLKNVKTLRIKLEIVNILYLLYYKIIFKNFWDW